MFTTSSHSNKQLFQVLTMVLCCVLFIGVFMLATTATAYCDDIANNINTAFTKIAGQIYSIMKSVIVPCCIVALGFAGFQFLVGGSQGAEKARKVVIACACGIGFVVFAPMVIEAVAKIINSGDNADRSFGDYNPLD